MEGTSDEALKVKKNGRRKKASFSKSGDEEIPTSSGGEAKSDLLAVSWNLIGPHWSSLYFIACNAVFLLKSVSATPITKPN